MPDLVEALSRIIWNRSDPRVAALHGLLEPGPDWMKMVSPAPDLPLVPRPDNPFAPGPEVVGSPRLAAAVEAILRINPRLRSLVGRVSSAPTLGSTIRAGQLGIDPDTTFASGSPIIGVTGTGALGRGGKADIYVDPDIVEGAVAVDDSRIYNLPSTLVHEMAHAAGRTEPLARKAQQVTTSMTVRGIGYDPDDPFIPGVRR